MVNGSTLMAFGLAILFIAFEVLEISNLSGLIGIGSAIWFLLLGVYEFAIVIRFRDFFDEDCKHYNHKYSMIKSKKNKHDKKQ